QGGSAAADANDALDATGPDQVVDDRRRTPDLVVGGSIPVGAILLAHHFDGQATARGHLLGSDVARKGWCFLHAEVEQDGFMAPGGNELFDEDDVFAAGVQVADD